MKKILLFGLFATTFTVNAQLESRLGVFGGVSSYYSKANFLSSRSAVGLIIGATSATTVTDNSEILLEASISRNNVQFRGREDAASAPVWIKFTLDRINLNLLYDYKVFHFSNDNFAVGACGGLSGSIFQNYELKDPDKESYLLEPYGVSSYDLEMDSRGGRPTFTYYAVLGANLRYKQFEAGLRYYKGLNNAYKNFPTENYAPGRNFEGKDNYMTFTITYFFDDDF